VVAFVHAKGHSERLPNKNLRQLGDRPLFCHAVDRAMAAEQVDAVVIDSNNDEILRIGEERGAIPLRRPAELATNETTGDDLARWQASNAPESRIIVQVVPTSPFVLPSSIDRSITAIRRVTFAIGARRDIYYQWNSLGPTYRTSSGRLPNSSKLVPILYETTGLYAMRTTAAMKHGRRAPLTTDSVEFCWLSRVEAIDINTPEDFEFAEIVLRGMGGKRC
jgi:CMP-N-acetylneuraminic acid synthetase